jgi:hypothetical protein
VKVVVPLAGPDFEREDGSVKAELLVGGQPLLRRCLEGRGWWQRGQVRDGDLVFVLRDTPRSRRFAAETLAAWYPGARIVTLSATADGAALSALAGIALTGSETGPLCVDLVDIEYRSTFDPSRCFAQRSSVGAAALVFHSTNPAYSYLRTDNEGNVVEAAEKRVISQHASVGTYFFDRAATYLEALAHNLRHAEQVTHRGLFFVCPLYNGVIAAGRRVILEQVHDVRDVKIA